MEKENAGGIRIFERKVNNCALFGLSEFETGLVVETDASSVAVVAILGQKGRRNSASNLLRKPNYVLCRA